MTDKYARRRILAFPLISLVSIAGCGRIPKSETKGEPRIVIKVLPEIVPIAQPLPNSCWATVWAMMLSWRDNRSYTVRQSVERLGTEWLRLFDKDEGLPPQNFFAHQFLSATALHSEPPANYTPQAWRDFLTQFGPLWINTGDGPLNHAKLLVGISRIASTNSVTFEFIDPQGGQLVSMNEKDFFDDFEREARYIVDQNLTWPFRFQILHW